MHLLAKLRYAITTCSSNDDPPEKESSPCLETTIMIVIFKLGSKKACIEYDYDHYFYR